MTTQQGMNAFFGHIIGRRYGAAGEKLVEIIQEPARNSAPVGQLTRLLDQCQRLADDQQQLNRVLASLTQYEEQLRDQLLRLVDEATIIPVGVDAASAADSDSVEVLPPRADGLAVWLLGSCWLSYRGAELDLGSGDRATSILRFLAAQSPRGVHKEQLATHFWPDAIEQSGRRSLHQAIYTIRRQLAGIGADAELRFVKDRYVLGGADRWRDIDELERSMAEARRARERGDRPALVDACRRIDHLYTGHFLDDQPYDDWAEGPRQHFRNLHREAASVLLDHHQQRNESCRAVAIAERLLKLDPADEDACRHLMRAQNALGQSHLGVNAFATQTRVLADQYGVGPSSESVALANGIGPDKTLDE